MSSYHCIPTFIINSRSDTKDLEKIKKEFAKKDEFEVNIIRAKVKNDKTIALLETIKHIVKKVIDTDIDYFLVCTEQHKFSDNYSKEILLQRIGEAMELRADVLCGGLASLRSTIRVSKHLFWIEDFSGLPFTIIFRSFFKNILNTNRYLFSSSVRKFFIYPFISIQNKDDCVSIAPENGGIDHFSHSETSTNAQIEILENVIAFYNEVSKENNDDIHGDTFMEMVIPTYIINLPERTDRLEHIKKQFNGKDEFDIYIIEACKKNIGAVGLWETIRKIVRLAMANDQDLIIICEDDHEFTANYSKSFLFKNIIGAYGQHTEVLLGGIGGFNKALPVSNGRAWINDFYCTQFTVLYKSVFKKILDEPYDNKVIADGMLSRITGNIMVYFPFISIQKYFGYSDVTETFDNDKGLLNRMFDRANERLKYIYKAKANVQNYSS